MQLVAMRTEIIAQLEKLPGLASVQPWAGDVEKVLGQPKAARSAFVAPAGGRFLPMQTMPPGAPRCELLWDVILFLPAGADAETLEAVVAPVAQGGLSGLRPTGGGILWPTDFELVSSTGLANAYRITFELTTT
ncbi:MAG: hypothetical protein RBR06_06080 [Desulfuromonadaceae bacterium]|nr:hypothetical protein [Desulfuromonadaceae bacterium]